MVILHSLTSTAGYPLFFSNNESQIELRRIFGNFGRRFFVDRIDETPSGAAARYTPLRSQSLYNRPSWRRVCQDEPGMM